MTPHAPMLRVDTATVLRRYFHLERALILTCAGWIPAVARLETKAALAEAAWQMSLTANELRGRVFELRYPERVLEREPDITLIDLVEGSMNAPDPNALLRLLGEVLLPALRESYTTYLRLSDPVADGPTYRFLHLAAEEKTTHARRFADLAATEAPTPHGERWVRATAVALRELGGIALEAPPAVRAPEKAEGVAFRLAEQPARDDRYFRCSFYWPDNFDPSFPYGDGARLQLRTAISHLNEVWAVETAGAILVDLGPLLGWDYILDAARWCYDESRHMQMGALRLESWGFERDEVPLGSFIYEACAGEDIIYRLGMLSFFETKNIGKKAQRAQTFGSIGDVSSQRDMEFDWADEAIHAGYGRRWLREILAYRERQEDWKTVLEHCEKLVARRIARATAAEKETIVRQAEKLSVQADTLLSEKGHP